MSKVVSRRKEIQEMADRVVTRFNPEKIILFGSHARGEAGVDSDVDLLVVMPVEGSKREKQVEIRTSLSDMPIPKDVIVTKPEEFEWRKEVVGTIERSSSHEGIILYERDRGSPEHSQGVGGESGKRS